MTNSEVFGLFRYQESFEAEPGITQYDDVQLLDDMDIHSRGTRFSYATIDFRIGVMRLRGPRQTFTYRLRLEATERITNRQYYEMIDGEGE
jgi:hypothetical protein